MCEDSVYSLYSMKMERVSISLIGNLGRCCRQVVLLLRCDFSIADTVLFDCGWEKEKKGVDCAFFFFFFNFEILFSKEVSP